MRRIATIVTSLSVIAAGAFVIPSLSQAASGTGVYATWSLTDSANAKLTFPGTVFPGATVTSTDETLQLASSAVLGASTPFGLAYGASNGKQYLSAALASGKPSGTVTITFDTPPTPGTYGFALGDIDAENIKISATGADGAAISVAEWLGSTFNYDAKGTDLPNWDPATGTLTGNGVDTDGASLFFVASDEVKSITFQQVRTSGFPRFQLWIAADVITAAPVQSPSAASASPAIPTAPDGKVVICHRTNSKNNPYVQITVSQDSIDKKNGHDTHNGPVFPAANWGDIIPPFGSYAGKNWPAGAGILNNGCETGTERLIAASALASASATASSTASATASASASASASTTESPSASASSSSASSSASASASPSASSSASSSTSPSPSPTESASATPSASSSATPSATASEASSTTPTSTASTSTSPSPSASPSETPVVVNLITDDPQPAPADPRRPTTIDPGPGNTVTEVEQPEHGTVDVRDGDIVYTPEPGYVGPVEIPVTVTDRRGNVSQTVLTLNVGKAQTVPLALPATLKIGDNVLADRPLLSNAKQRAVVDVACRPLMRIGKTGDVRLCETWVVEGRTYLRIHAPAKVEVKVSAPAKGAFAPFDVTKTYLVR